MTGRDYFLFGAEGRCVKAEAATDLTGADVFGFDNNLLAVDATLAEVFSLVGCLVAMVKFPSV